jgi:hypothetical protein
MPKKISGQTIKERVQVLESRTNEIIDYLELIKKHIEMLQPNPKDINPLERL